MYKIYDRNGNEVDQAWLAAHYGNVQVSAMEGAGYYVTELREATGPCVIEFRVLDRNGKPVPNLPVAWYWPDAPNDNGAGPKNGLPAGIIPNKCHVCMTNVDGYVAPSMGGGAKYDPKTQAGPHALWVYGNHIRSQVITGLGWLMGTNHDHINIVIQFFDSTPGPPPEPPPPPPPPPPPDEYATLTVRIVGSGQVSKVPDLAQYPLFSEAIVTATPSAGWLFDRWASGSWFSTSNPLTIVLSEDVDVTAIFIKEGPPEPEEPDDILEALSAIADLLSQILDEIKKPSTCP